jgi:hypothetical protein
MPGHENRGRTDDLKSRNVMRHLRSLLCLSWLACVGLATADGPANDFIDSREELDAWLSRHPTGSPLDALTPGARERFIMSLSFGPGGVGGFDASDLMDELSDAQIHAVLALFGPRALEVAPPSHYLETRRVEKHVREPGAIGAIERRYNSFYAESRALRDDTDLERAEQMARLFDTQLAELFETKQLRRADDHELRILRAGARRVALATRLPRHVDAFRDTFDERVRRTLVSSDDAATLYNLNLALRRFPDANRLRREYPLAKLPQLPRFVDTLAPGNTLPTVWRLDAAGKRLTRETVDLAGTRIIVTAACHLSKDAAAGIAADASLAPVFERHALWLTLAPGIEDVAAARDWNREFPRTPVAMIYDRDEWRMIPDWRMPQFHVVRDGREVESLAGWDGSAGTRAALIALLERHALLDRDTRE